MRRTSDRHILENAWLTVYFSFSVLTLNLPVSRIAHEFFHWSQQLNFLFRLAPANLSLQGNLTYAADFTQLTQSLEDSTTIRRVGANLTGGGSFTSKNRNRYIIRDLTGPQSRSEINEPPSLPDSVDEAPLLFVQEEYKRSRQHLGREGRYRWFIKKQTVFIRE